MQVIVPLISANEREVRVVSLAVREGEQVSQGTLLAVLETTKATVEVEADQAGYIVGLRIAEGDLIAVGETICQIEADPGAAPLMATAPAASEVRLTQAARALCEASGLALDELPRDRIVTETQIQALLVQQEPAIALPDEMPSAGPLILFGGGRHARMLIELLAAHASLSLHGIVDDSLPAGTEVLGARVLGGRELLTELRSQTVAAVNGLGSLPNLMQRLQISQLLRQRGFAQPPLTHPRSIVEPSAQLAPGAQVLAGAYVGTMARLGEGAIVNTGAIVSHDCQIGTFATISPGAVLAGDVTVGARAVVGMGVLVNVGVQIGEDARIGNGAIIQGDVPPRMFVQSGATHA